MNKAGLLLLVAVAGLLLILILLAFFTYSPIFSTFCYVFMYIMYVYFTSEQTSRFHQAQENENRFWTILALLFSTTMLFTQDSPLALGLYSPTVGFICILLFTYAVHTYDRYVHRKQMGTTNFIRRNRTTMLLTNSSDEDRQSAQDKVSLVQKLASDIDSFIVPSTVNNYLFRNYMIDVEKRIIAIFREASPEALNYMVHRVKLGLIFYKIKDHMVEGGNHRTQLVELLVYDRISVLTISARALVLDALQKMYLTAHTKSEQYVRAVLLATRGDDLSQLKSITDAKGDFHSLHKLIYNDIKSQPIQQEILDHIKNQANVQAAHMRLGTKRSKERNTFAWRKILSDVDDTLTCSAGRYPAGIDKRYPKKAIYPGVIGFYRELDLGTNGSEEWRYGRVGNLCFLSARPHVYKDLSEKHSYTKFKKLIETRGLHTPPTMLAGSLESGGQFILQGELEGLALKKFQNFEQYFALYPEFKHIFIADNGQGDVRAAEMMIQKYGNDIIEAVFIHKVQPIHKTYGWNTTSKERWEKMNIRFFDDYIEAAFDACKQGLIRARSFHKIAEEVKADFHCISRWKSHRDREFRRAELNKGLRKYESFLRKEGLPKVKTMLHVAVYPKGTHVLTPFGYGVVRDFRERSNMYKVELWWGTPACSAVVKGTAGGPVASSVGSSSSLQIGKSPKLTHTKSVDLTISTGAAPSSSAPSLPQPELDSPFPSKNRSPFKPVAFLQLDQLWDVKGTPAGPLFGVPFAKQQAPSKHVIQRKKLRQKPLYRPKEAVLTPFGCGIIKSSRTVKVDASSVTFIYQVSLEWGNPDTNCALGMQQRPSLSGPLLCPDAFLNEACLELAPVTRDEHGYYILSGRMLGLLLRGRRRGLESSSPVASLESKAAPPLPKEELLQPGTLVATIFGAGFVLCHRAEDGIVEIQLAWELSNNRAATAYMRRDDVKPEIQMEGKRRESFFSFLRKVTPKSSQANLNKMESDDVASTMHKFSEGDMVSTPFGKAQVLRHREEDSMVEVEITSWLLSNGQLAKAYLNPQDIKLEPQPSGATMNSVVGFLRSLALWTPRTPSTAPLLAQGTLVKTAFGVASVVCHRPMDDIVEVRFMWLLTNNKPARGYLHRSMVVHLPPPPAEQLATPPSTQKKKSSMFGFLFPSSLSIGKPALATPFDPGTLLATPYGHATVIIHRPDGIIEANLTWDLANGQPAKAYLHPSSVKSRSRTLSSLSPIAEKQEESRRYSLLSSFLPHRRKTLRTIGAGKVVLTPYGCGTVIEVRSQDGMVVVDLDWILSHKRPARAFLNLSDVKSISDEEKLEEASTSDLDSLPASNPKTGKMLSYLSFGLLASSTNGEHGTKEELEGVSYTSGEVVQTQYGPARVVEQRASDLIIVVHLMNWGLASGQYATAYIHPSTLFQDISTSNQSENQVSLTPNAPPATKGSSFLSMITLGYYSPGQKEEKKKLYLNKGVFVTTAFGAGRVIVHRQSDNIIEVELTSWSLKNRSHPSAFMNIKSVDIEVQGPSLEELPPLPPNRSNSSGVFSFLKIPYLSTRNTPQIRSRETSTKVPSDEESKYSKGCIVETPYGTAQVIGYREKDKMYHLQMKDWCALLFAQGRSLSRHMKAKIGSRVLTTFGTGILEDVRENSTHIVRSQLPISLQFLQPSEILQEIPAVVGDDVKTLYGQGRIVGFRKSDQMYIIKLQMGTRAILYCSKTDDIIKVDGSELENLKAMNDSRGFVRFLNFRLF